MPAGRMVGKHSVLRARCRIRHCCALEMLILISLLGTGCGRAPRPFISTSADNEWLEFQGTWTATGARQTMQLGSNRRASIANLSGSLLLAGPRRPGVGFRAEAILLNDSATGMTGRAVWVDKSGDQVYSELRGEGTATSNRVYGTFLGGTGRYAGVTGSYEFSWRFVLETGDGTIQGQSEGLTGRARLLPSNAATKTESRGS